MSVSALTSSTLCGFLSMVASMGVQGRSRSQLTQPRRLSPRPWQHRPPCMPLKPQAASLACQMRAAWSLQWAAQARCCHLVNSTGHAAFNNWHVLLFHQLE